MTNKQAMVNLSDEAFFDKWYWLTHEYGKGYTDSRIAIIEWLGKEAKADSDLVRVVRCRDCRYWEPPTKEEVEDGCTYGRCRSTGAGADVNDFCSSGEREG